MSNSLIKEGDIMNKKGQGGLSINTIIVAIIAVVVLLLIVTFFTGGMSTVFSKIRGVFTGGTAGYDIDLARSNCQGYCERAKLMETNQQADSTYCKQTFDMDGDGESTDNCYETGSSIRINCPGVSCT